MKRDRKKDFNNCYSILENGCWFWNKYKNKKGYGSFYYMGETLAHRSSYLIHNGNIPEGNLVCHSCDNPSCVNPKHLWVGTNSDNQIDCVLKGRAKRNTPCGEKNHLTKLSYEQVLEIRKHYSNGVMQKEIALIFNTDQSNISYIVNNKTRIYA